MSAQPVDVRWVAELAIAPNGMHEIRAGAVNARERPLVGYAASYADACQIAEAHNNSADVAELIEAAKLAQRLHRDALPKFNWGASMLDANAIMLLNTAPGRLAAALAGIGGGK